MGDRMHPRFRPWLLGAAIAFVFLGIPVHRTDAIETARATPRPFAISSTAYGLRLTIETPQAAYPANALVPVTVLLRNVSGDMVPTITNCGVFQPHIELVGPSGQAVYQPTLPEMPLRPTCDVIGPPTLMEVGTTWRWTGLKILRGMRLKASVAVATSHQIGAPRKTLATPLLTLRQEAPRRTVGEIATSPDLHATFARPAGATVYYTDRVTCAAPFETTGGTVGWQAISGETIRPSLPSLCPVPARWQLVMAVQGQAPRWFDRRLAPPPLPAGGNMPAQSCTGLWKNAPFGGLQPGSLVAMTWDGATYLAGTDSGTACRLIGPPRAIQVQVDPMGHAVAILTAIPGQKVRYALWIARLQARSITLRRVAGVVIYRPDATLAWSPNSAWLAYTIGNGVEVVGVGGYKVRTMIPRTDSGYHPPVAWTPGGSAAATLHGIRGPSGRLAFQLIFGHPGGGVSTAIIHFPAWIYNVRRRPIGSLPRGDLALTADGRDVILSTAGGRTRLSGVWEAPVTGGTAHLIAGTRARVTGHERFGTHLDRATHLFGSPDGRYAAVDAATGFWVIDTRTLRGMRAPVRREANCTVSQSAWTPDERALAYISTCSMNGDTAFRSELWVTRPGGTPRHILTSIDRISDAIHIATVSRCLICGLFHYS